MTQEQPIRHQLAIRVGRVARLAGALGVLGMLGTLGASVAPALAAECPNEQLRIENNSTQLPECRAYEMVSPPYKEGYLAYASVALGGVFTDDGTVAYSSLGSFAGSGMAAIAGNQYLATRATTGWGTTALNPSGPQYFGIGSNAEAMSSDIRSSLWLMRLPDEPSQAYYYYVRGPDGSFTRVGPAWPFSAHGGSPGPVPPLIKVLTVAVSDDLSHFLFTSSNGEYFPGDTTTGNVSLYEYAGTGNTRPQLVGVDNTGELVSTGGTCSNGMSTDGRVVFFNPGCSGQVWARINETTSVYASASQCTRTAGDPGGACNGASEPAFAGMAADGSRVFFTTSQQLVNGDTDQTQDIYACDIPPGTPAPVGLANPCASLTEVSGNATGADVQQVLRVSADGSHVYFTAHGVLASNLGANDAAAVAGEDNLYLWQKDAGHPGGQTTFVGKLDGNFVFPKETALSADNRYFVFATAARLVASDTDEAADVYRYDADTGALLRLSTDTSGTGGNTPGLEARDLSFSPMSADGSTVVFQTAEALSPADTDGIIDVYEWHDGQVSQITSGGAETIGVSPSGTDIYLHTPAQVLPQDGDTVYDIYDARVDGGFPVPHAQPCSGEGCQGALTSAPRAPDGLASSAFSAANSPPPPETPPANLPKGKSLTRAQKLAKTLNACRSKHNKRKRVACQKQARRAYARSK